MDTTDTAEKYQKASTVCCSANVLLFLAHQSAFPEEVSVCLIQFLYLSHRRTIREFSGVIDSACMLFSTSLPPSRSHAPLSVCACHCYSAGDIKVLEKCTQLTDVNFWGCEKITGESSAGRFLSELRTVRFFGKKFLF